MKFLGKEIPTDKINFVMNVVSFILGMIFFIRMQHKMNEKPLPVYSKERDSLMVIQTRVSTQLKDIKAVQDSLIKTIGQEKQKLTEQKQEVIVKRKQLLATVNSDWDNLDPSAKESYVNNLMSNLSAKSGQNPNPK